MNLILDLAMEKETLHVLPMPNPPGRASLDHPREPYINPDQGIHQVPLGRLPIPLQQAPTQVPRPQPAPVQVPQFQQTPPPEQAQFVEIPPVHSDEPTEAQPPKAPFLYVHFINYVCLLVFSDTKRMSGSKVEGFHNPTSWAMRYIFAKHGLSDECQNELLHAITHNDFDRDGLARNADYMKKLDEFCIQSTVCQFFAYKCANHKS